MQKDPEIELQEIFRRVFHRPALQVTPHTTAKDVPGWDSLTHMSLIAAIETHFGFDFTFEEVRSFATVGDIIMLIRKKTGG